MNYHLWVLSQYIFVTFHVKRINCSHSCHVVRLAVRIILCVFARSLFLIIKFSSVRFRKYALKALFLFAIARRISGDHHGTEGLFLGGFVFGIVWVAAVKIAWVISEIHCSESSSCSNWILLHNSLNFSHSAFFRFQRGTNDVVPWWLNVVVMEIG